MTGAGRAGRAPYLPYVAAIGCVVYAILLGQLTPPDAQNLFWLELSFTPGNFLDAVRGWIAPGVIAGPVVAAPSALASFRWAVMGGDFVFIACYVIVLVAVYRWLERTAGRRPLVIPLIAAVAAGLFDALENVGILWLTWGVGGQSLTADLFPPSAVAAMSTASAVKWSLVALVAVFIVRALLAGARGEVLLLSRYSLLSIALVTAPLVATGQGQDLLAALAETPSAAHRAFFFAALATWGLSVWYWSRTLLDAGVGSRAGAQYAMLVRHLPRTLGVATLLTPVFPLLKANASLTTKALMVSGCAGLATLFVVFVRARRKSLDRRGPQRPTGFSLRAALASPALRVVLPSAIVSFALFGFFVFAPVTAGNLLGAVAILLIAAANTVFFGSLVVFASRASGVAIEVVALLCAAAFSFWNDNHSVAVTPAAAPPTLADTFGVWVRELKASPHRHSAGDMPVFLVAAEGGGIRAAYWTATVLGGLNDAAVDEFARHVFVVNGISGGSLGAAVYASLRQDAGGTNLRQTGADVLRRGYLAPVMSRLVTGDFLQWFVPVPVPVFDRSRAFEDAIADSYASRNPALPNRFVRPFLDLHPSAARGVPALALSATSVEHGARVLTAPFAWTMKELPDVHDYHYETDGDPTLAAAVHNSARFSYVSPAGRVRGVDGIDRGHVIDGGYFDPSGVETILDLRAALSDAAAAEGVTLVTIFITNDEPDPAPIPGVTSTSTAYKGHLQPLEVLGEAFAPVRGVLRARDAHGRLAAARHELLHGAVTFGFCETPSNPAGGTAARLQPPLGWELSKVMADRLDQLWDTCSGNVNGRAVIRARLGYPTPVI